MDQKTNVTKLWKLLKELMAEQNARQRMKLLPSMESHSHRPSRSPPSSTNSSILQGEQTYFFKRDQSSDEGNQEETIGDGVNIHHRPSNESNQEL